MHVTSVIINVNHRVKLQNIFRQFMKVSNMCVISVITYLNDRISLKGTYRGNIRFRQDQLKEEIFYFYLTVTAKPKRDE